MLEHTFWWNTSPYTLLYLIEEVSDGRQLILEDLLAESEVLADSIPEWMVEYEASCVAESLGARYI